MLRTRDVLLLFWLVGAASALYKQWIPDTNYENGTNWDRGSVPCGNDHVAFPAWGKVSVFVGAAHAVREVRLPLNGEFLLNPGAGFFATGGKDLSCGAGVTVTFLDFESLRWSDPALWRTAATWDDLQSGRFLFAVHEESVPCRHDDVVFRAETSFRVDTSSSQASVPVRSVSLLGRKFDSDADFSRHLDSRTGQLQFHGSSAVSVGHTGCQDPSGCDCGNSADHRRICQSVACSPAGCRRPLRPTGHCCDVCGAIVTLRYSDGFSLELYRSRLQHLFLSTPQYRSVRLGMSKVLRSRHVLGVVPLGLAAEVQVVILDGDQGALAESLARDIVQDARAHGSSLGITGQEFEASTGGSGGGGSASSAGTVVGIVLGVLVALSLSVAAALLVRRGIVRMPPLPSLSWSRRSSGAGDLGGTLDRGFDNPMFDRPPLGTEIPGLHGAPGNQSIAMTQTGVHFVNPVYDEHSDDFTV